MKRFLTSLAVSMVTAGVALAQSSTSTGHSTASVFTASATCTSDACTLHDLVIVPAVGEPVLIRGVLGCRTTAEFLLRSADVRSTKCFSGIGR